MRETLAIRVGGEEVPIRPTQGLPSQLGGLGQRIAHGDLAAVAVLALDLGDLGHPALDAPTRVVAAGTAKRKFCEIVP